MTDTADSAPPDYDDLLTFAREAAALTKDGEDDGSGGEYVFENDHALDIAEGLIGRAREILGLPDFIDPAHHDTSEGGA